MATKTRAEMISWVLENIGIKAATVTARDEDSTKAGRAIDALFERHRKDGLAPYATSAFPEWAQQPFVDLASRDLLPIYRIGGEMAKLIMAAAERGQMELHKQVAGVKHPRRVTATYY